MSIIVVQVEDRPRFTQVPNDVLRDPELKATSKVILSILLSHSDGWQLYQSQLASQMSEGKHAISTAFKQLEELGYLVRTPRRSDDGTFTGVTDITVHLNRKIQQSAPKPAKAKLKAKTAAAQVTKPDPSEVAALLTAADELVEAQLADVPEAPSRAFQQALTAAEELAAEFGTSLQAVGNVRNQVLARAFEHLHGDLPDRWYPALYRAAKTLGDQGHRWLILAAFATAHRVLAEDGDVIAYAVGTAKRLRTERAA